MPLVFIILLIGALVLGPQLWIRWVFFRYGGDKPDIPGTGGELATHLLKRFGINDVVVEKTEPNRDHFDSSTPAVRLSPNNFDGKSLTAIAVAAHEVGHALQWHKKETVFKLRSKYIPLAMKLQRIGFLLLSLAPFTIILTRIPIVAAIPLVGGLLVALCGAATYLIILPEEWDASFNKAMPILIEGEYITADQQAAAKRILRAAALTYVAAALASILQFWRWLPFLLRR